MRGQPAANSTAFVLAKKLRLMGYVVRCSQEYPDRSAMTGEVVRLVHRIELSMPESIACAAPPGSHSFPVVPERAGGMLT